MEVRRHANWACHEKSTKLYRASEGQMLLSRARTPFLLPLHLLLLYISWVTLNITSLCFCDISLIQYQKIFRPLQRARGQDGEGIWKCNKDLTEEAIKARYEFLWPSYYILRTREYTLKSICSLVFFLRKHGKLHKKVTIVMKELYVGER